jgi:hypothetical protein
MFILNIVTFDNIVNVKGGILTYSKQECNGKYIS